MSQHCLVQRFECSKFGPLQGYHSFLFPCPLVMHFREFVKGQLPTNRRNKCHVARCVRSPSTGGSDPRLLTVAVLPLGRQRDAIIRLDTHMHHHR